MAEIGKFCSVAKKGTIIMPKKIAGYKEPEGQALNEDGQVFTFKYTPIEYNISYDFANGHAIDPDVYWHEYNIEQEYIPPTPVREDYTFIQWTPERIATGTMGDVKFVANWKPNAILLAGEDLNNTIDLSFDKTSIMAIEKATKAPDDSINYINISSTATPILAWLVDGCLMIYCDERIYCNKDMDGAFSGMVLLRDINTLQNWICPEGASIVSLFENCALLSDTSAVNNWANGNFANFSKAFKGTPAAEAGRVPTWYRWNVKVSYLSSTGKVLLEETKDYVPDQTLYAKAFAGYATITPSVVIDNPDISYSFTYRPITYTISYSLNGGEISNPKTEYTIEDETYYPPEAVKPGFKFTGWDPECIKQGDYGNVSFIANYINE